MDRTIDLAGATDIQSRYTHSDQVDEPLLMEVFDPGSGNRTDTLTYHTDHLGSVRYMTDASGNLANFYDYDSYGRPIVMAETTPQPFMYTAREWDNALGLYQYRARQYVFNNPLVYTDPLGQRKVRTEFVPVKARENVLMLELLCIRGKASNPLRK